MLRASALTNLVLTLDCANLICFLFFQVPKNTLPATVPTLLVCGFSCTSFWGAGSYIVSPGVGEIQYLLSGK